MKWFDRKFSFDMESWMLPNVVERLRGTPARCSSIVSGLPADDLKAQPSGEWSIQENIGHLVDLEPLWFGRIEDMLESAPVLREADLSNTKTNEAGHNKANINHLLESLASERAQLIEKVDRLQASAGDLSAMHPRLQKPMRLIDLLFFVAEHDDHHMSRITRIKQSLRSA
jgi:uncharacterized damage-inducible protein DinB